MFGEYAGSGTWTVVHLGQFGGMAIFLAGLLALYFALDAHAGTARWAARFGAAAAVATMALYGLLQAVDGVALKQAVTAWVSAPDAEKAARFASAEAIRWLEWGVRSYQNVALGLAVLLFAVAAARAAWVPRPVVVLMGLPAWPIWCRAPWSGPWGSRRRSRSPSWLLSSWTWCG